MATAPLEKVCQHLRRIAFLQESARLEDKQLLQCFIIDREEAAFEALVRRHGSMVLGVCRIVLKNRHDAEDAFQATFLVLLRKAASIKKRVLLANWLYGVAHRTAMQARRTNARRQAHEKQAPDLASNEVHHDPDVEEMLPHLDQALSRLPDKYRVPIILCDLGGKTRTQAARQLAVPERTFSTRLARGRAMLAKKLARHRTTLAGEAALMAQSEGAAKTSVPIGLVASTVQAATVLRPGQSIVAGAISVRVATLIEGVVMNMLLSKLKIALSVVLTVAALATGIGTIAHVAHPIGLTAELKARRQQVDTPRKNEQPLKTKKGKTFSELNEIDLEKKTVTIFIAPIDKKGNPVPPPPNGAPPLTLMPVILNIDSTTKIIIDAKEARFADLKTDPMFKAKIEANVEYEVELPAGSELKGKALRIETYMRRQVGALSDEIPHPENGVMVKTEDEDFEGFKSSSYLYLAFAKDLAVEIDGQNAHFSDLKTGMWVSLHQSAIRDLVVEIRAVGPRVVGVVKSVDADQNAMSISANIKGIQWSAETIPVRKNAKVVIDGKQGKLSDLRPGMPVTLQMSAQPDQRVVVAIKAAKEG